MKLGKKNRCFQIYFSFFICIWASEYICKHIFSGFFIFNLQMNIFSLKNLFIPTKTYILHPGCCENVSDFWGRLQKVCEMSKYNCRLFWK